MKYYVKACQLVSEGIYKTVVLRVCDTLEEAQDLCYMFRTESGLNCFVDQSFRLSLMSPLTVASPCKDRAKREKREEKT